MSVGKKELLCSNCRKRVSYHIFKRPAKTIIKDIEIKYEEYYGICDECKSEIFIPGLDDRNDARHRGHGRILAGRFYLSVLSWRIYYR